ncbi:MAG: hypothetical protein EOP06_16170 [Proteobacteria bacterium]|nr:MAG: hypothetical protein EOP06_16170 [Pseudomonadota bacterium]
MIAFSKRFDPSEWQAETGKVQPVLFGVRDRMANDLIDNVLKKGMSREAVENLLGRPDVVRDYGAMDGTDIFPSIQKGDEVWLYSVKSGVASYGFKDVLLLMKSNKLSDFQVDAYP